MPEITKIEPQPTFPRMQRVGVYCRVSSTLAPQLASLSQQISYFTKMVPRQPMWQLTDIYTDIKSGETVSARAEFNRLLNDCRSGLLDVVITKSISRMSRDTVELLSVIRELRSLGVEVIFEQEMLSTADNRGELMISAVEAMVQAENDSRSQNVRWGIVKRAKDGTAALYKRRCYGYFTGKDGNLQINEKEAEIVRSIFSMYLAGKSLVGIIRQLGTDEVKTPTGKEKWSKRTIDHLLSNEKYSGNVEIFKTYTVKEYSPFKIVKTKKNNGEFDRYVAIANHPAVISKKDFDAVQDEKARRTNVEYTVEGAKRKSTRYSAKRDVQLLAGIDDDHRPSGGDTGMNSEGIINDRGNS